TLKELYLLLSMLPVMGFILFFIQARYLLPIVPVAILWLSVGSSRLGDWLVGTIVALRTPEEPTERGGRPYWHMPQGWSAALQALPVFLLMAWLLAMHPTVIDRVTNVGSVREEHRLLGEYLAGQVSRDTVIMCRYPAIAFHADARWVPTPNATVQEVLSYARHKQADYWVIDERELRYRPQFVDLTSRVGAHDEWEELARMAPVDGPSAGDDLVVFALRP
ncbi:MAG: hypothetical protein JXA74_18360, partial [Anaerolineae bacterium]|nr:hypothetical protein [Anaerolineae bacterium]